MKRSLWWIGALAGFVSSLVTMAASYLGSVWISLPFFPFDIFDWLARHLPGSIIEFGLSTMIRLINALKLGPTASTAKLAEQIQALGLVAVTGVVFGLVLALFASRWPRWLDRAGLTGGALLWIGVLVVEIALAGTTAGLLGRLIWLFILLVGWGWYLARFMRRFLPVQEQSTHETEPAPAQQVTILDKKITRRAMLGLSGAGLVSVVVLLLGLRKIQQEGTTVSKYVPTPAGGGATLTPHSIPYGPEYTSGSAASPSPAVLAARIEAAPGTRPEIDTPDQFYRVDINTVPPEIDAAGWQLKLGGMVQKPITLSFDDLWARPSISQALTLACISNPVGGDLIGTNFWTGFRFKDFLDEAGVQSGAKGITIKAADGFYESIPLDEAMDDRTLLVYAMNGAPLTADHGYPLRLYVPDHYGMKLPKWITDMNVTDKLTAGYWFDRGWSATAVPQTTSVIDTTSAAANSFQTTGVFPLGGIAWSGARGISKVEVQIDDAAWVETELRNPALSPLTWVQWRYDWQPASGRHTVRVRATDGAGVLQDPTDSYPQPEGATGIDSVTIDI